MDKPKQGNFGAQFTKLAKESNKLDFPRQLLEETPDAVIAFTPDGKVLHWNRAAQVTFGFTRNEAVGQLLVELFVPPDRVDEEPRIQCDARFQM